MIWREGERRRRRRGEDRGGVITAVSPAPRVMWRGCHSPACRSHSEVQCCITSHRESHAAAVWDSTVRMETWTRHSTAGRVGDEWRGRRGEEGAARVWRGLGEGIGGKRGSERMHGTHTHLCSCMHVHTL